MARQVAVARRVDRLSSDDLTLWKPAVEQLIAAQNQFTEAQRVLETAHKELVAAQGAARFLYEQFKTRYDLTSRNIDIDGKFIRV